ncbi:MAG TPA: NAD(P)-binding domain-containing protein [Bacteroidota bacterium]|jgi:predicted dinucleotide-binding enzyme
MATAIGIIGSGMVAQTLANGFLRHGYEVMIGTNSPAKMETLRSKTKGLANIGSFEEAAKFGALLVLAVKGSGAESALRLAGIPNLEGKTVIDTTNPISDAPPVNGVLHYFTSMNDSLMERLQKLAPGARFVKAFSCVGNNLMVNPDFKGVRPTMFICGNDDDAKKSVREILDQFGYEIEDLGKVEGARAIEPLCILWCIPGFLENRWTHAYKVLK